MRISSLRISLRRCTAAAMALIALSLGGSASAQMSRSVGLLKGDVVGTDGSKLPGITVTIFKGTEKLLNTKSSPDGKFTTILQPNATYRVAYNSDQYGYHEDTVVVPLLDKYQEFPLHAVLMPLREGQSFTPSQPIFMPKSINMERAATAELDALIYQMKHNAKLMVNVTVYPDAPIASKKDAAQQKLVDSRVTAIRSYFMSKGISASNFSITTSTSVIPQGRFTGQVAAAAPETGKKKKKAAPAGSSLFPPYVEITAHIAS